MYLIPVILLIKGDSMKHKLLSLIVPFTLMLGLMAIPANTPFLRMKLKSLMISLEASKCIIIVSDPASI